MKYAKRILGLLLSLVIVLAMVPATALAADTIAIKVRVFDQTTGMAYEVGTDTVDKASSGVQSQPYTIKPLSAFTKGTYKTLTKVAGNWYFPSGDRNVGSVVYFSNNASTATITYWVTGYEPYTEPVTPPGETTPPSTPGEVQNGTAGAAKNVWLYIQVVYTDYNKTTYNYGEKIKVYLDCQSTYCKHTQNCSIRLKDFHPTAIGLQETMSGCKWIGWSKYSVNLTPEFKTFYNWTSDTTNLVNPSNNVYYLIYQSTTPPTPGESGDDATDIAVTYHDGTLTATQSGLAGDSFTILNSLSTAQDGREFLGWAETDGADAAQYTPGQQVTFNASTDLYAVWKQSVATEDWTIQFTAGMDGVTGLPAEQTVSHVVGSGPVEATLPEQEPEAELLFTFQGWSVQGSDGTVYAAGDTITLTQEVTTLVAQWTALDVDGDGAWTYVDAMLITEYLAGEATLTEDQLAAADYNGDGAVDYLDAMAIMDALGGSN